VCKQLGKAVPPGGLRHWQARLQTSLCAQSLNYLMRGAGETTVRAEIEHRDVAIVFIGEAG